MCSVAQIVTRLRVCRCLGGFLMVSQSMEVLKDFTALVLRPII